MKKPGEAKAIPFVEDTAVSPEKLPEYVKRFDEIVRQMEQQLVIMVTLLWDACI